MRSTRLHTEGTRSRPLFSLLFILLAPGLHAAQVPGTFGQDSAQFDGADGAPGALRVGDLNADGSCDILMVRPGGDASVVFGVHHQAGAESYLSYGLRDAAIIPRSVGVGDLALVVDDTGLIRQLRWDSEAVSHFAPDPVEISGFGVQPGDVLHIGVMETATGVTGALTTGSSVTFFERSAGGTVTSGTIASLAASNPGAGAVEVADFDGDGSAEAAVVCNNKVKVIDGDGSLLYSFPGGAATNSRITSFHDDVLGMDLLVVATEVSGSAKMWISVMNASNSDAPVKASANITGIASGDLNGDGHPDLACTDQDGTVYALYNAAPLLPSTPHFTSTASSVLAPPIVGSAWGKGLAVADLEGDGDLDVLAARDGLGALGTDTPQLAYLHNLEVCAQSMGIGITSRGAPNCVNDANGVPIAYGFNIGLSIPSQWTATWVESTVLYEDPSTPGMLLGDVYDKQLTSLLPFNPPTDTLSVEVPLAPDPDLCRFYLVLQAKTFGGSGELTASSPARVFRFTLDQTEPTLNSWPVLYTPPCLSQPLSPEDNADCECSDFGGGETAGGVGETPPAEMPPRRR